MIRRILTWPFRTSWKIRILIIVVAVVVAVIVSRFLFSDPSAGYVFDTAQRRTISETVSESGSISTSSSVNIYSPTKGVVESVLVENGQEVVAGTRLFSVVSTATAQEKSAAYAALKAAEATLSQAENTRRSTGATVQRVHDEVKGNDDDETFEQKEDRTTAEVANDNAYEALLAAQAQLVSARSAYQATQNATVTATVKGVVSNLSAGIGSGVTVNSALTPSSPVLQINTGAATEVEISVGESDINKIQVGQEAVLEADAVENKTYMGLIVRVDENGTITNSVVKFNAYVQVLDADELLRPGMTIDADIETNVLSDVLSVPNAAVKPYQGSRAVRVLSQNGEIEYIPVEVGVRGTEYTQILDGLSEGQEIIVSLTNEQNERPSGFGF